MNNEYLEDQVVRYYSYRLFKKRENEKMADSVEHSSLLKQRRKMGLTNLLENSS